MVAARGPVPKRTEVRRRVNKPEDGFEISNAPMLPVEPLAPNERWCDEALEVYTSASESGQAVFYQQSDWAILYLICDQINQNYQNQFLGVRFMGRGEQEAIFGKKPMPAAVLSAVMHGLGSLGMTEGDRRRIRIELTRGKEDDGPDAAVVEMEDARSRLTSVPTGPAVGQ
jgi:hypothetical protein